jgi:hypothetical protein
MDTRLYFSGYSIFMDQKTQYQLISGVFVDQQTKHKLKKSRKNVCRKLKLSQAQWLTSGITAIAKQKSRGWQFEASQGKMLVRPHLNQQAWCGGIYASSQLCRRCK